MSVLRLNEAFSLLEDVAKVEEVAEVPVKSSETEALLEVEVKVRVLCLGVPEAASARLSTVLKEIGKSIAKIIRPRRMVEV